MNRKISQFEVTTAFNEQDLLTLVQDGSNRNITGAIFRTTLSTTFATNDRVDQLEQDLAELDQKIYDNYWELYNKIIAGDQEVTQNLTNTMNEYYQVLNNSITILGNEHEKDMNEVNDTVQGWIDEIGGKADDSDIQDLLNRITELEKIINQLAEEVANGGGSGGGGGTPGYHTQSTSTIFPLTGYYYTGDSTALKTTDTLNQALSKLEGQVKNAGGGGSGGDGPYLIKVGDNTQATDGNVYSALRSDRNYISKTTDDTAQGYVKYIKGIQGGETFREGFLGEGASLWPRDGKWKLEVDELFVRGGMTVNELIVNEIKATGGDILVSIADLTIVSVERDAQNDFKCFYDNLDGTRLNKFRAGDQAICQIFDGENVKRYWRLVKEVGGDYITLSETVCESGSADPEAGDTVIQLGNRYPDGADRRSALMISAYSADGPNITMYDNIDDFTLAGKQRTTIGKQSQFIGTIFQASSNGDIVRVPADKGEYVPGTTYYYYDRVSYNGSLWLCIATETLNPPSEDNEEWLLQVAKGEAGTSGSDKAKWVEIIGERLFMYDNPRFEGTPDPAQLVLVCETYNLENPVYKWTVKGSSESLAATPSFTVLPTHFGENRNLYLRCTVTDGLEIFYDDVQLAKLGDGSEGADAYYIDLSNGTVSIPYDVSGGSPSIPIDNIFTEVNVYKGTILQPLQNLSARFTDGSGEVRIDGNKVHLVTLGSTNGTVTITVTVDNLMFTKQWYINKTFNGEDGKNGFDGVDAAYVMVSGGQTFRYDDDGTVNPATITLYATAYNITNPTYKWYWSIAGEDSWTQIDGEFASTIEIHPRGIYFNNSVNEVTFKIICEAQLGGNEYFDMITVNKLYNGKDGTSPYRGILTNESHTLAADYNGNVSSAEMMKATTSYMLYSGTTKLGVADYSLRITNVDNNTQNKLDQNTSSQTLTLSQMGQYYDSTIFKVEFLVPAVSGEVVDVVDFSITKAKGGKPGDYEIIAYCRSNETQPATPTMTTRPPTGGLYNQGNYWYPSIPTLGSYQGWMSTALFDGGTGLLKSGESWSLPLRVTGKDGAAGATGPTGPAGSTGPTGPTGPGLNYRGTYDSTQYYYNDGNLRDVVSRLVSNVRVYYAARKAVITPGWTVSEWDTLNSFENIATGLLFAEEATIANWQFSNSYIRSLNNEVCLNGDGTTDTPVIAAGGSGEGQTGYNPTTGTINKNAPFIVYQSGILQVGPNGGAAGISGTGGTTSTSIRFWAGATYSNRSSAPFQVDHAGNLLANKCTLTGTFQTSASGLRILISPQYIDNSLVMQAYKSTGELVTRVGAYDGELGGFVGVYNNANSSTNIVGDRYAIMNKGGFETYYRTAVDSLRYLRLSCGSTGPIIYSSVWPTESQVTSGYAYKDASGYLKIK